MNPIPSGSPLRHYGRIFLFSGPVGLLHALKVARLNRRLQRISVYIDREKELHRSHLAALHHEQNQVISELQGTQIAAAQFWRYCEKGEKAAGASGASQ